MRERKEHQQLAKFEGMETSEEKESNEEKQARYEADKALENEMMLWEYSWVPSEWDNPTNFGEKFAGWTRRVFVTSQLQDRGIMDKLMAVRPNKVAGETPMFSNSLNGRFVKMTTLQRAMQACSCTAVVYDLSQSNRIGILEGIDVTLRLIQALVYIDERKVALDIITQSCFFQSHKEGLQEPFHAAQMGLCRSARIENPQHEFRVLDIDRNRREKDMPLICRYLLGAQNVRPAEALVRDGGLFVARLVGSRTPLKFPIKLQKKYEGR
jgi:hypothetical protein